MAGFAKGNRRCDLWLWDGSMEYEASLVRLRDGDFTAHVREAGKHRASRTTRRLSIPFVEMQRRFHGKRFLSSFKACSNAPLLEAEINSVQRSSTSEYEYFVCGRFRNVDGKQQDLLRALSSEDSAELTPIGL